MKQPARSIQSHWLIHILLNLRAIKLADLWIIGNLYGGLYSWWHFAGDTLKTTPQLAITPEYPEPTFFGKLNVLGLLQDPERSARLNRLAAALMVCLAFLSGGCVQLDDPEASQEYRAQIVAVARPDQPVGQSFVARRTPIKTIQLWLRLESGESDQTGSFNVELYHAQTDSSPLISVPLSATAISSHFPIAISIPDFGDPPEQSYYIRLVAPDFPVQVFGRDEEAYPRGSLDQNQQQLPGDLSFRLSYVYNFRAVLEDFQRGLLDFWLLIPLLLTVWLPGRLVMDGLHIGQERDWAERIALAVGLSLAVIAVAFIWTSWVGLSFGRISITLLIGLLGLYSAWRAWRHRSKHAEIVSAAAESWTNWAMVVIFILSLWVRMAMVRDLAAPPWVDSVHHGMITRLILSEGQLPQSYAPFLEIETANYHTGFHSGLAIFNWLSGLDLAQAMLIFGQVLNASSIFAAYLFTTTFTQSRTAGVFAALVSGLFSPMPAYLTSWGRYPQLAGLLVLPVAIYLIQQILDEPAGQGSKPKLVRQFLAAGLAGSGLLLIHYRVVAFMALLLIAWQIVRSLGYFHQHSFIKGSLRDLSRLSLIALAAFGWAIPWLPAILQSVFPKLNWTSLPVEAFSDFSWGFLTSAWGLYALYAAGSGILAGLILKKRFPWTFGLWLGLMLILANPALLGLPGGGFVNNISIEISLFLPIAAAAGFLPGWLLERGTEVLPRSWRAVLIGGICIVGLVAAFYAGTALMPILNPSTFLFREADRQAITWIEDHLPSNENILINPFAWGYGLYAGNDGGYWIAPLAGHPTLPPPALYGLGNQTERIQSISSLSRQAIDLGAKPDELRAFLLDQDIHYVYTGARGGAISPASLDASAFFQTLYHQDGAWVFEVIGRP